MSAALRGDPFNVNARRKTSVLAHAAGDLHKRAVNAKLALKLQTDRRLKALAPDLLNMLRLVLRHGGRLSRADMARAQALVAQATGESA